MSTPHHPSVPHLPLSILPVDGRFGSGPSKVRPEQAHALVAPLAPLGQSHRKPNVISLVGEIRRGLTELFSLPDGYEVLLGNGGASLLWDAIAWNLAEVHVQAAVCGAFSEKAATACIRSPWVRRVDIHRAEPGSLAVCSFDETDDPCVPTRPDVYLYPHNETSTGVISPVRRIDEGRVDGGEKGTEAGTPVPPHGGGKEGLSSVPGAPLTIVDATSAAGGVLVDISQTDFYYFSPQKCFGADGGLWIAIASPQALERIARLSAERTIPAILDLNLAVTASRKDQTYNTPAISSLILLANQVEWMLENGGLAAMAERCVRSSAAIYSWAEARPEARPFVVNPEYRSPVVATIDMKVDSVAISQFLRGEGIMDIEPYRSLGRSQLRIGTFPNVDYADIEALLACLDWCLDNKVGAKS